MQLQVKGKNLDVSESIRTYAERKLAKLDKSLHASARVEVELGVTGLYRPRAADAVVTVDAPDVEGDAVTFVSLPDGTLLVEDGGDSPLDALAAAVEQQVTSPYRARAVRRGETLWAVEAKR